MNFSYFKTSSKNKFLNSFILLLLNITLVFLLIQCREYPKDPPPILPVGGISDNATKNKNVMGTVRILLTDKPSEGIEALHITISRVDLVFYPAQGTEEEVITVVDKPLTINLLTLLNGMREILGLTELPQGTVSQIRLIVSDAWITINGKQEPVKVPSGVQTGIKLSGVFVVTPNSVIDVVIDFDAEKSIVYTKGQGYLLKPVIKILNELELLTQCDLVNGIQKCNIAYFFEGKPFPIPLSAGRVRLKLSSEIEPEDVANSLADKGITLKIDHGRDPDGLFFAEYDASRLPLEILSSLNGFPGIEFVVFPLYLEDSQIPDMLGREATFLNRFYVKFKPETTLEEVEAINSKNKSTIESQFLFISEWKSFYITAATFSNLETLVIANRYLETELAINSSPSFRIPLSFNEFVPNDPIFPLQWNMHNTGQGTRYINDTEGGTPDADIDAPLAWWYAYGTPAQNILTTVATPKIAIIDSGTDFNHPEFAGKLLPGCGLLDLSDTCPAYTGPDTWGLNCGCPFTPAGSAHGTSVAGITAGGGNNNQGIAGIAWNAKIIPIMLGMTLPIPLLPVALWSECRDIAMAFMWAIDPNGDLDFSDGADVINNSWGYGTAEVQCQDLIDFIWIAAHLGRNGKGTIIVFAAGNAGGEPDPFIKFPQNQLPDEILVAGATDFNDDRHSYSSVGAMLDLMAPAGGIGSSYVWSTDIVGEKGYDAGDYRGGLPGTSFAAPHVSGASALLLALNPLLTREQIQNALLSTLDPIPVDPWAELLFPWIPYYIGGGRLNVGAAAEQAMSFGSSDPSIIPLPSSIYIGCGSQTTYTNATISNVGNGTLSYIGYIYDGFDNAYNASFPNGYQIIAGTVAPGYSQTVPVTFTKGNTKVSDTLNLLLLTNSGHTNKKILSYSSAITGDMLEWVGGLPCLLCIVLFGPLWPFFCGWLCYDCVDPPPPIPQCNICFAATKNIGVGAVKSQECSLCKNYLKSVSEPLSPACDVCIDEIFLQGEATLISSECQICKKEYETMGGR